MSWGAGGQTRTPGLGGGQGAEELTGVAVAADMCGWLGHSAAGHCGQMTPCLGAAWACHPGNGQRPGPHVLG